MEHLFLMFLDHTQRRTTVGRTPLDEWSARRRDLYLTTHNTHNRQTSMSPVGFEPTISADERPQTHALDRAATGTGLGQLFIIKAVIEIWPRRMRGALHDGRNTATWETDTEFWSGNPKWRSHLRDHGAWKDNIEKNVKETGHRGCEVNP